jgi:hypothetical protein
MERAQRLGRGLRILQNSRICSEGMDCRPRAWRMVIRLYSTSASSRTRAHSRNCAPMVGCFATHYLLAR